MASLNSKFDVLRGWLPGGDSGVDQSFPVHENVGVPVTLEPGMLVEMDSAGEVDVASTPDLSQVDPIQLYVVVEGNDTDFSAQFVGKVVCLRGKLTIKTDQIAGGQAFAVGSPVTVNSGLLEDKNANDQIVGYVLANDVTANGTITVEVDL